MPGYLIGLLIFAILIAILAVQNAGPVSITIFFWRIPRTPLVLVMLATTLLGLLVGILIGRYYRGKPRLARGRVIRSTLLDKNNK